MRNTCKYLVIAALAAMTVSCQKAEIQTSDNGSSPVFTAVIDATKSSVDAATGKVSWDLDDIIQISDGTYNAVYTIKEIKDNIAFFVKDSGGDLDTEGVTYTAKYGKSPATAQTYKTTIEDLPMTATSTNTSLQFSVSCGIMQINMAGASESVKSIAVKSSEGTVYTLTCDPAVSIDTETPFYITLPAGTYNELSFTNAGDYTCTKTGASIAIKNGSIQPINFANVSFTTKLDKIDYSKVVRNYTATGCSITWNAVENAEKYNVKILQGNEILNSDTITNTEFSYNGWTANTSYTIMVQATSTNPAYSDSDWVEIKAAYDTTPAGTELFFEDFSWITAEDAALTGATEALCQDGGSVPKVQAYGYSVPKAMVYGNSGNKNNRVYVREGLIKMGRAKNDAGSNGELFLPMDKVFENVADGAIIDINITAVTCSYSKVGKKLFVIVDTDGVVTMQEYAPTTGATGLTEAVADKGMTMDFTGVRKDSKICFSTAWESGITDNRVFFDDIKIVRK